MALIDLASFSLADYLVLISATSLRLGSLVSLLFLSSFLLEADDMLILGFSISPLYYCDFY